MRRALVVSVLVLAALALAACGGSGGTASGGITVSDAWALPSPMMERAGAAYMVLRNNGAAEDKLLSVESDVAKTIELHETKESSGMMAMSPVPTFGAANGKTELKPGGLHVMLIGLNRELKAGDKVQLALNFEKAGKIPVTAEVGAVIHFSDSMQPNQEGGQ
jgi:copper(I)-binding protein